MSVERFIKILPIIGRMIHPPATEVNALFCLHVALRLTEKMYAQDSRVVVASLETGLGADFDGLMNLGLIQAIAGRNFNPHFGEEGVYRPFQKRNGELDEADVLEHYTPGLFPTDAQRVLENRLKSLVLANPNDDLNRIRFFPNGKMDPNKEPDIERMSKDLRTFYADEKTIAGRLGKAYDFPTLTITPLQARLDFVKMWDDKGGVNWKVVSILPSGVAKNYLSIVPQP